MKQTKKTGYKIDWSVIGLETPKPEQEIETTETTELDHEFVSFRLEGF